MSPFWLIPITIFLWLLLHDHSKCEKRKKDQRIFGSYCTGAVQCPMRRKIKLVPVTLAESQCGVPDSAAADFMLWDRTTGAGKSVLMFKVCPWCGEPFTWQSGLINPLHIEES